MSDLFTALFAVWALAATWGYFQADQVRRDALTDLTGLIHRRGLTAADLRRTRDHPEVQKALARGERDD